MTLARKTREHAIHVLSHELGARGVAKLRKKAREWGVRAEVGDMVDLAHAAIVRAGDLVDLARNVAQSFGRPDLVADLDFWTLRMVGTSPDEGGRPRSDLATFAEFVSPDDDRIAALAWVAWGSWELPARAVGTPAKQVDAVRRAVKKTRAR